MIFRWILITVCHVDLSLEFSNFDFRLSENLSKIYMLHFDPNNLNLISKGGEINFLKTEVYVIA